MRILYHCADHVGAEMAGPGIRAVELCRRLASKHEVTLSAPGASALNGEPFTPSEYDPRTFAALLRRAEVFISQGFGFPSSAVRAFRGRLVLDLYDPVQLENLTRCQPAPTPEWRVSLVRLRLRLRKMIRRADHVLCASPLQRALWLGWLGSLGRITPDCLDGDPTAARLLALVPFGVSEDPPAHAGHPLRVGLGLPLDTPLALWGGGLWDWMDPALAVRAFARLKSQGHSAHLALLAGSRPGVLQMRRRADEARALTQELQVADRVHFVDRWIPYAERGAYLLDADLAVSAHHPTLEAELAFRTRLLDCLWAGLPVACTSGDVLASEADRDGWGIAVPPGDADGLATAIAALLEPARRAQAKVAAAEAAKRYQWATSAGVLLDLLDHPAPPRRRDLLPGEIGAERLSRIIGALAAKALRRLRR